MYIYMCVCVCVYMYLNACMCMYVYIYIYIYMYIPCVCTFVHLYFCFVLLWFFGVNKLWCSFMTRPSIPAFLCIIVLCYAPCSLLDKIFFFIRNKKYAKLAHLGYKFYWQKSKMASSAHVKITLLPVTLLLCHIEIWFWWQNICFVGQWRQWNINEWCII